MILEGRWLYVCWSAFCIYNYILIISGCLCFTTSTFRPVCVLICIHAHCSIFYVVWLFGRHTLCPQVFAHFSPPGCFSHFAVFLFTRFLFFPLSSATKTQNRRECGFVQNQRQIFMSLCRWQQLCSASSEAVSPEAPTVFWLYRSIAEFAFSLLETKLTVIFHHDKKLGLGSMEKM